MSTRACLILILCLISPAVAAQPRAVTFSRRQPAVGDQAEQTIAVDFNLKTTTRSGAQVLEEGEAHLRRDHQRVMTATALGPTGPVAATVEYLRAEQSVNDAAPAPEPVVGKAYHCQRRGDALVVTTAEGLMPPMEEFQIVSKNMETLGRENPLARFFDGKTVKIGERIDLPIELAAELLGFEEEFAAAKRFTMRLTDVREIDGRLCAEFATEIEAGAGGSGQMGMIVAGPMVMQIEGCRAVSAELSGPIGVSDTQPAGPGASLQVTGVGKLSVAISTRYRDRK